MRMMLPIAVVLAVLLYSCEKDGSDLNENSRLTVILEPTHEGSPITPNQVVKNIDGRNFSIEEIKVYFMNISLENEGGEKVLLDDLFLFKFPDRNSFQVDIPKDNYKKVSFGVGLDKATNDLDPVTFPDGDDLSISQDMYWDMLKYRFIVIEGRLDTSAAGNQSPTFPVSYHLGRDTLYTELEIPRDVSAQGDVAELKFSFDVARIFYNDSDTIDMLTNFSNHSLTAQMPVAVQMMNNFTEALQE